jgi:hypothetical protein
MILDISLGWQLMGISHKFLGVVSLKDFQLVLFLAELNHLQLWATDIGNTYLGAYTSEKVYIIAGIELKYHEGHIFIIFKAIYGL